MRFGIRSIQVIALLVAASHCGGTANPAEPARAATPADPPPVTAKAPPAAPDDTQRRFDTLTARFLAEYLALRPDVATALGEHRYDDRWPDVSVAGAAKERAFYTSWKKELAAIDPSKLGLEARVDHSILANQIELALFTADELRSPEVSPIDWTGLMGDGLDPLLSRDFAPLAQRLASVAARLEKMPDVVAAAKARLRTPARIQTETAILQNKGLIDLVTNGLAEHLQRAPEMRSRVEGAAKTAKVALEDFQHFLEGDLLPRSTGDFRLGREHFTKKLRLVLDDPALDPEELRESARALLDETREQMVETALEVWPLVSPSGKAPPKHATKDEKKALVRQVLAKVADDRSTNATIVGDARRILDEATDFVRENDLVRLPDEQCRVIEMPEYRRGVAVAYCDSTGPLEAKQESFFAIAPTPKDWSKERATSFYREYNRSMLRDLTVHEAMPGHFLQAIHQNRFKSDVRAVFSNGPFVEGWAVYGEWMMAQHGFGGPKTRLARQKTLLRTVANTIIDHDIHAGEMDEKAALALMKDEAFQEDGEAVGKWKRARLTSTQLSTYYYGFREMMRVRLAAEKKPGFSERAYHDALLAHGSPPMRQVTELVSSR